MKSISQNTVRKSKLELKVSNGTNDIRYLDFNRLLYFGVPQSRTILEGKAINAQRDKIITELFSACQSALSSGSASSPTIVNYYVEFRKYVIFCDQNKYNLSDRKSVDDYCNHLYQRVLRNEIKCTAYSSQISKLKNALINIDVPTSWFEDIAHVSSHSAESYEAYSQSDLRKMLPLLRGLFKQLSMQFLLSPEKHQLCPVNKTSMIFTWQGCCYHICGAINKMMCAATFLLAYYTYTNSSQLYQLARPSRASFSTKELWYSMPAFKRRAFKVIHVEMGEHSIHIPKYSMEFFDRLLEVSRSMDPQDGGMLLQTCRKQSYKPMSGRMLTEFVNFLRMKFRLLDDRGRELRPQISRFRETGCQLTEYYQGDVAAGIVLNNTRSTRQRHYSSGNKYENQSMMQETALIRAEQARNHSSVPEARSALNITVLTLEEYNNRLMPALSVSAHGTYCSAPYGEKSEKFNRKASSHQLAQDKKLACAELIQCFGCEHQVIIQSVDDLWCLMSFRECLEESLYLHLDSQHHKQNFKNVIAFIDLKILPTINRDIKIKAEQKMSNSGRHPLWQEVESFILHKEDK